MPKSKWCRSACLVLVIAAALLVSGCSDPMYGLTKSQQTRVHQWQAQGVEIVQEKDPATATVLGFFIGLGSFYTNQPVLGVVDLLFWPLSILWEPWIAPAEANKINYQATKDAVEFKAEKQKPN